MNMKQAILVGIVMVGGVSVGAACSSDSGKGGKGTGGTSGIVIGTGSTGAGTGGPLNADGLAPLTADQAAQLTAAACEGWSAEPEGGPAVLEFQIDTTTSMTESPPSAGGQTKWAALQQAMPQAFAALPSSWAVGLTFFARPINGGCYQGVQSVPIAPLTDAQRAALDNAVRSFNRPSGYTPTEAAYVFALDRIQAFAGSGSRYIVLETDGVPTVNSDGCTIAGQGNDIAISSNEYAHLIGTVSENTASTGVKTFVVGVPGSEDPQGADYDPMYQLSLLAAAGGTAIAGCTPSSGTPAGDTVNPRGTYCHYDMTQVTDFASALVQTIGTIAGGIVSCNYTVPPAPAGQVIAANQTNMVYDDGNGNMYLVQQNTNATCDVGWHFTDATNQAIEVCSGTCGILQSNPQASITLTFGCMANQIPE
jgi:hypothetical protein